MPTEKQAKWLWMSVTALAVIIIIAACVLALWCLGWFINRMSTVLLPLAVAGIFAYVLNPLIEFLEHNRTPRLRAILLVFVLSALLVLVMLSTVVPQLIAESSQLINQAPDYFVRAWDSMRAWLKDSPMGIKAKQAWQSEYRDSLQQWLTSAAPMISQWLFGRLKDVVSGAGMLIGMALVPVYTFYFLLNQRDIEKKWTDYLPLQQSKFKDEVVFIFTAINDSLAVFFRGQMLVALCVGVLITVGFSLIGLNYAVLLGTIAAVLGIIPYLGTFLSMVLALGIAGLQFSDWIHPLLVLGVFGIVQLIEGFYLSPKIIGDRVGLHPVAVIIALMIGTSILGGILGGILAIPLTAALRAVLNRYVWKQST